MKTQKEELPPALSFIERASALGTNMFESKPNFRWVIHLAATKLSFRYYQKDVLIETLL